MRLHAADPVPWREWSPDVFRAAAEADRLVFVTVGFAACHWCHVMQHESFADPEIAALLGQAFVPVVVDREQRPDLDQVLLDAVRALGGRAGWPATLILTPAGDPVFVGGYLPPRDGERVLGLLTVLGRVRDGWQADRAQLLAQAAANSALVRDSAPRAGAGDVDAALTRYREWYDPEHGGFGGAPKFPNPALLRLVLDLAATDDAWRAIAVRTARAMAEGALRDPIVGGFHRYTVDAAWERPHFEKIATDNALLARWYLDLGLLTGDEAWTRIGEETVAALAVFLLPDGSYANALDASADGPDGAPIEGLSYTWTAGEVAALGPTARVLARFDERLLVQPAAADRARFQAARAARTPPRADDLWVASTQVAVARALIRAGRVDDARVLAAQIRARPTRGVLDDDAAIAATWLDLFEATTDPAWLALAIERADQIEARLADPAGGWFRAPDAGLWVRPRDVADPSGPSGTSELLGVLDRLAALTEAPRWQERARRALARGISANAPMTVDAAWLAGRAPPEIVVAWPRGTDPSALLAAARGRYLPGRTLVQGTNDELAALAGLVPLVDGKVAADRPTAWICRGGACDPPRTDPGQVAAALRP